MASDVFRYAVLKNEGGVYLDIDQLVNDYDLNLHKFDFVGYSNTYSGVPSLETSFMASIPHHPIVSLMLADIIHIKYGKGNKVF